MLSKSTLGGTAIVLGVLIAANQYLGWSGSLQYLWAVVAVIWGIMVMKGK